MSHCLTIVADEPATNRSYAKRHLGNHACLMGRDCLGHRMLAGSRMSPQSGRFMSDDPEEAHFQSWLREHHVTEVECIIADINGIARGKILPGREVRALARRRFAAPAGEHLHPDGHRRVPRGGRDRPGRPRHPPAAGPELDPPGALVPRADRPGARRLLLSRRLAGRDLLAPRAAPGARSSTPTRAGSRSWRPSSSSS